MSTNNGPKHPTGDQPLTHKRSLTEIEKNKADRAGGKRHESQQGVRNQYHAKEHTGEDKAREVYRDIEEASVVNNRKELVNVIKNLRKNLRTYIKDFSEGNANFFFFFLRYRFDSPLI